MASILADCLGSCTGTIDGGSPGPICGWSWVSGSGGNSVSFIPGVMSFDIPNFFNVRIEKAAPSPSGLAPSTIQYTFNEFAGATDDVFYDLSIQDSAGVNSLDLYLDSTGTVYVQYGPNAGSPFYDGVWIPTGGNHVVHLTLDALGVPTLYIDGVLIPLVLGGSQPTFATAGPGTVSLEVGWSNAAGVYTTPGQLEKLFVTGSALPVSTIFCCG